MGKYVKIGEKVAEVAESAATVKRGLRAVGEAPDARKDLAMGLGGYEEYTQTIAPKIENPPIEGPPSKEDLLAQIDQATMEQEKARRSQMLTTTESAESPTRWQTNNRVEYAERINKQLRDPMWAAANTLDYEGSLKQLGQSNMATAVKDMSRRIKTGRLVQMKINSTILGNLKKDPRAWENVKGWYGDAVAYRGEVYHHIEVMTDPTKPGRFRQYDQPRELGLHAGTNRAAESVPGMMEAEEWQFLHDDLEEGLNELSAFAGMNRDDMAEVIGRHVNRYYLRKFSKYDGDPVVSMSDVYDDYQEMIEYIAEATQGEFAEGADKLVEAFRRMPQPNSTPLLFRGQNGLLLKDMGGFRPDKVGYQLKEIFNTAEDWDQINTALGKSDLTEQNKLLQKFIESKGYDHVVYHNTVEDRGQLSVINWNPDLMVTPWDAAVTGGRRNATAQAVASVVIGILGLGGANAAIQQDQQGST